MGSPETKGGVCCLSRREPSRYRRARRGQPRPQKQSVSPAGKGSVDTHTHTHTGSLPQLRMLQPRPPPPPQSRSDLGAEHGRNSCKFAWRWSNCSLQQTRLQNKRERNLSRGLPPGGSEPRTLDIGYTAQLQREWGSRRASPAPGTLLGFGGPVSRSLLRGERGPPQDKPWEGTRSESAMPPRPRRGDGGRVRTPG